MSRPSAILATVFALSFSATAWAQPRDSAAADAAFERGRVAMSKGDFVTACSQFAESYRLDPAVGTQLNMSLCEEKQGKLVAAHGSLTEVVAKLPKGDPRITVAESRLDALKKRIPTVTLRLEDADAHIARDGVAVPADALDNPLPLDPGSHAFVVTADGHAGARREVVLKEGERIALRLDAGAANAPATRAVDASTRGPAQPEATDPNKTRRIVGIGALALGGVGVATGVVTGILTLGDASTYEDHCPSTTGCDDKGKAAASSGRTLEIISPVAFGIGALSAGVGAYLLLTSKSSTTTSLRVGPHVSSRDAGLAVGGAF